MRWDQLKDTEAMIEAFERTYADYIRPRARKIEGVVRDRLVAESGKTTRVVLKRLKWWIKNVALMPPRSTSGWLATTLQQRKMEEKREATTQQPQQQQRQHQNPLLTPIVREHADDGTTSATSRNVSDVGRRILPPLYLEALAELQDARRAEEWAELLANTGYVLTRIDQTTRVQPRRNQ